MNNTLRIIFISLLLVLIGLQLYKILVPHRVDFDVCPVSAIRMEGAKAIIDTNKCIGCRRCVDGFPVYRLTMPQSNARLVSQPPLASSDSLNARPEPAEHNNVLQPIQAPKGQIVVPDKKSHRVDQTVCIGCGLCVATCPVQAITMVNGKAFIDKDKCTNCGICKNGDNAEYAGCPVSAISAP